MYDGTAPADTYTMGPGPACDPGDLLDECESLADRSLVNRLTLYGSLVRPVLEVRHYGRRRRTRTD